MYETQASQSVEELYFQAMNGQQYQQVANLFTQDGLLRAPFNEVARGRPAIAAYLETKSAGMVLYPQQTKQSDDRIVTVGRVRCTAFWVNASWEFQLESGLICSLKVGLIGSLLELYAHRAKMQ